MATPSDQPFFSRSSLRLLSTIGLMTLVGGLVLICLGAALPSDWHGIKLADVSTELGSFVIATFFVHWIFEIKAKQELMIDISKWVIGNEQVSNSGICDFVNSTKQIDYGDMLASSDELIIGLHYSPRFIEDYQSQLLMRAQEGKPTTVALIQNKCAALKYLKDIRQEDKHIEPNLAKIDKIIADINAQAKSPIDVIRHETVLRYSFVKGAGRIWLKFYLNSRGIAKTPGIQLKQGAPLYELISSDIDKLLQESKNG